MTDKPGVGAAKSRPAKPSVDPGVYNSLFVGAVLGMSWQLAVVVVVPIVLGNWLDGRFGSMPWLTLAGLLIALLGTVAVMWRTVRTANARVAHVQSKEPKK